ncbi:MAG: tail fiber domain-containing protein [Alphaproteobacteria bacterium]
MKIYLLAFAFLLLTTPTTNAANSGDFSGAVAIGTSYAGIVTAPVDGVVIQGNVGIGTTTPSGLLHVSGSADSYFDYYGNTLHVFARRANGTSNSPTATQNGDILSGYLGTGYHTGGWNTGNAGFQTRATQNHTSSAQGNKIEFFVTPNGATSAVIAATIDHDSTLNIGAFAASSATHVCRNGNTLSSCSSARRFKENIKPSSFGLKEVLEMKPVTFDFKDHKENWEKHDFGFIAEDMRDINPLFVTYDQSGKIDGVRYMQLAAVQAKAIQELNEKIVKQQAELDELKRAIKQFTPLTTQ